MISLVIFHSLVEFLKTQWKNLKENFKRCKDKRVRMTRSGVAAHVLPKCKYFENLMFLNDKISNQETESNITLGTESLGCASSQLTNDGNSTSTSSVASSAVSVSPAPSNSPIPFPLQPAISQSSTTSSSGKRKYDTAAQQNSLTAKQKKAAKEDLSTRVDALTLKYLEDMRSTEKECELGDKEDDADFLFLKSLLPCMKQLPKRKNRQARLKIQQVLFGLEDSDDE